MLTEMAEPVFIHKNMYERKNNPYLGGGVRAIGRDFNIINNQNMYLFIEPFRCGLQDVSGNVLYSNTGCTNALKSHYSYNVCVHKKTKEVYLFVESGINTPRYLPLLKV